MKIYKKAKMLLSIWIAMILVSSGGLFIPLIAFGASPPVSVTLSSSKDGWISEAQPLSFFGTSTDIQIQSSGNENGRGLISFDLSSIPSNATITSAVMSLFIFITPQSDRTYNLFDIKDPIPWDEQFLNWNNQPTINSTAVSTSPISSTTLNSFISWDVATDISKMIISSTTNQGWEIRDAQENGTTPESKASVFRAREYSSIDSTKIPKLTITYTLPSPIATTTPVVPNIISPISGATIVPGSLTLKWSDVSTTTAPVVTYSYSISTSTATTTLNSFLNPIATSTGLTTTSANITSLPDNTYYWQVRACDPSLSCSSWSNPSSFVLATPAVIPVPVQVIPVGGGGGGNGPIAGSYGVIAKQASNNFSTNNLGGNTSSNTSNNSAVAPVTYPSTNEENSIPLSNNTVKKPIVAYGNKNTNISNDNNALTPEQATTSNVQSENTISDQTQNNLNQTAAVVVTHPSFFSTAFWIWLLVIIVIIILIFYATRRYGRP